MEICVKKFNQVNLSTNDKEDLPLIEMSTKIIKCFIFFFNLVSLIGLLSLQIVKYLVQHSALDFFWGISSLSMRQKR